jgi:hypothetical protein
MSKIYLTILITVCLAIVIGAAVVAHAAPPPRWFHVTIFQLPNMPPGVQMSEVKSGYDADDNERICKGTVIDMQKELDTPSRKLQFGDAIGYCLKFVPNPVN